MFIFKICVGAKKVTMTSHDRKGWVAQKEAGGVCHLPAKCQRQRNRHANL